MTRRILTVAAIFGVFVSALLTILSILDLISVAELKQTLGKASLVIGVSALALVSMLALGRLGLAGPKNGGEESDR